MCIIIKKYKITQIDECYGGENSNRKKYMIALMYKNLFCCLPLFEEIFIFSVFIFRNINKYFYVIYNHRKYCSQNNSHLFIM